MLEGTRRGITEERMTQVEETASSEVVGWASERCEGRGGGGAAHRGPSASAWPPPNDLRGPGISFLPSHTFPDITLAAGNGPQRAW